MSDERALKRRSPGGAGGGRRGRGRGARGQARLFPAGYIRSFKEGRVPDTQPLNHKQLRFNCSAWGSRAGAAGGG